MISNYEGFTDLTVDKSILELPIGWWSKNKGGAIATVSLVDSGNIVIGGSCKVSKEEFLRGLIYNLLNLYAKNDIEVTFVGLDNEKYKDFTELSNVKITKDDEDINIVANELSLEVEKRLHLIDRLNVSIEEYNKKSPIKMPYKVVVLPDVTLLKESDFLNKLSNKLFKEENRFRGNLTDRVYVLDCLTNAYRAGVYFISMVDTESYNYLKMQSVSNVGLSELINGIKIGFNWDLIGLNTSYSMIGKGVVVCKDDEPYNFYSNTITRVDLINNLKKLK